MKLYISGDMEGVAGVSGWEQVDARTPHPEYATYRRYYTAEIAASIAGARQHEDVDVLVNDAHGPMRNLLFDLLPHDIRVISGNRKPYSMVQSADDGFDGAFFIGYHGAIGDANAVLGHTYTPSVIYEVSINGVVCSEATINAALLGEFGVALLLVSGDRTTVDSVCGQMPWVTGVIVKDAIGSFAADSISPREARRRLTEAATHAVANRASAQTFCFTPPIEVQITLATVAQADLVERIPTFERVDARQVRYASKTMREAFTAFVAAFRLGAIA